MCDVLFADYFKMSFTVINHDVFPSWIYEFFNQKIHRNESKDSWKTYFPQLPIPLQNYHLIMRGIHETSKPIVIMQILCRHSETPLKGSHKIFFPYVNTSITVPSLTYLKKFFQMKDRLSFERCTYICLWESKKLIRLKCIRGYINLPYESLGGIPQQITDKGKMISQRTRQQLYNCICILHTSFQRVMIGQDSKEVLKQLKLEWEKILEQLL